MPTRKWMAVAIVALAAAQVAAGEGTVDAGDRVRIEGSAAGSARLTGRLLRVDERTLVLQPEGGLEPVRFERAALRSLEVSRGMYRRTGTGALVGLAVGL